MIYVLLHVYQIEQTLVVKTRTPVGTVGPAIKQAVEALGPGRPVFNIRTMSEIVESSIDNTRFTMLVCRDSRLLHWCSPVWGYMARLRI